MARMKKHSVCWTICYAVKKWSTDEDPYTATWFAYGRSANEAKERFIRTFCAEEEMERDDISVLNVIEGFSC